MSASALQKEKPQSANKRPAENELHEEIPWRRVAATQPTVSSVAPWKRVKSEPRDAFLTQQQLEKPQKPMLGAWFGAARMQSRAAASPAVPQSAFARVKFETALSQDSEDDKPLARVMNHHQQQQQQQTYGQQQTSKAKVVVTPSPPQAKLSFSTAREAAQTQVLQTQVLQGVEKGTSRKDSTKNATAARINSQEDERVFQLSNKRRVTVRRWKSAVLVDIREYYDDNGVSKPGKKGISLAKDQWNTLLRLSREIGQAVDLVEDDSVDGHSLEHVKERVPVNEDRTIAFTLSSKRRITVRFFRTAVLVDLREYYEQGSEMKPGKKGISLSRDQWRSLQTIEAEISQAIQEV